MSLVAFCSLTVGGSALHRRVLSNPAMFLSFIGADQVVNEQHLEAESTGTNRGRVSRPYFESTNSCIANAFSLQPPPRWASV